MELGGARLRALVELARCGTMTAAAAALGYTPGAISQQIAALERIAGARLIRPVGRRVELTDAGHVLVAHAGRILAAQAEAAAALENVPHQITARLRLGVFGTAAAAFLPPALCWLRGRHPGVRVVSQEVDVDHAHAEVRAGRVDLALGLDYPDAPLARDGESELIRLRSERFALAVPARPPLAGAAMSAPARGPGDVTVRPAGAPATTGPSWVPSAAGGLPASLGLADAAEQDWILPSPSTHYGRAIRTACRRAGFEPRVAHEVTDTATSLAMVGAGLGVAPVTELMLRLRSAGITPVPLTDLVERHVVVAVRRGARARASVEALIEALRRGATA
ncbi:LysR family transcriptional regulator [Streptomyces sp. SP18CS02]|uniref:LysR family transcriptional regulator n=1 Tax=Streptomyces sp. SP18CS02 TaxID=3002531 RepID=UPI002E768204|nr:LysR family transcriptional regulator [Streptomyces sp. SP18CS02]MEE1755379.1 LysR family transcriptional regulator [Streptomyces sp. SP18CS02]